jgi:tripartite-type tricarboxylate transporter receptor subunit TctC
LNPEAGGGDSTHQYFGEGIVGTQVQLAKNAVVLLNHLCYASGNSEPGLPEGTLDVAMGSYTAAQSVLQSDRGTVFAVHSKKVDAIPDIKTLPEQGATSKFFTVSGFSGWAVPKATPQPVVDRLAELCVAANSDPKVKEVLTTFVLEPAIGFKETNALYQRELPIWIESARSLGLEPS